MEALPEDFVLYTEWPEYRLEVSDAPLTHTTGAVAGRRGGTWPLFVELFVSDDEPRPERAGPHPGVLVLWQRLRRKSIPSGWKVRPLVNRLVAPSYPYNEGFVRLRKDQAHYASWSSKERSPRRRWQHEFLDRKYRIRSCSSDEFWSAYAQSNTWKKVPASDAAFLKRATDTYDQRGHLECRVVEDLFTRQVVAGIAVVNSETYRASYYFIGFLNHAGRADHAMVGLFDDWFQRAQKKGYTNVQLGKFWDAHTAPQKVGFSKFKAQFGTEFITFPPALSRFVSSRSSYGA